MLKIQPITNKSTWQQLLTKTYHGFPAFFQSWNWGEVQKRLGFSVGRFGLYNENTLVGIFQVVTVIAKRGNYLHVRHGPVLLEQKKAYYQKIINFLKEIAQETESSFIRMSPLVDISNQHLFNELAFSNAPIHNMDAEVCWVLDITPNEETLLSQMRKSHRYLIKKSLKNGLEVIVIDQPKKEAVSFLNLYKNLAHKRNFIPHKGLVEELEVLGKDDEAVLLLAKYKNTVIAGALVDFIGPMALYHHGAASDDYKDLSASYLLQWEAIRLAKKRGKKIYNFWGIAPNESKKHPWAGLTLFKTGFGGEKVTFVHAKDLQLNWMYWKTFAIESITKFIKGY